MHRDAQLLEAWRAGDRDAGDRLFGRYSEALHRFFATKIGAGAEDLVQQTFLACLEYHHRLRDAASFRGYLFAVARSKLFDYLLALRKVPPQELATVSVADLVADLGTCPSSLLAREEEERLLLGALRRLPLILQVALELYYFDGLRGPELAEALGLPEGTVRSRLRRGRALLRDEMVGLRGA